MHTLNVASTIRALRQLGMLAVVAIIASGCGGPKHMARTSTTASTKAPLPAPTAPTLAATLRRAREQHGNLLLLASAQGIEAKTLALEPVVRLTTSRGRHLRAATAGKQPGLYFFVPGARQLRRLDLAAGRETIVATLPALTFPCFGTPEGADPISFVQTEADVQIDVPGKAACLRVADRNANMMSMEVNYRLDLETGATESAVTFVHEECAPPRPAEQPPLCEPDGQPWPRPERTSRPWPAPLPSGVFSDDRSASGRWGSVRSIAGAGDYMWSHLLIYDGEQGRLYAVTATGLQDVEPARVEAGRKLEATADTCQVVGESLVRWLPRADALVAKCANLDTWVLVQPPDRVRSFSAEAVGVY